MPRNAYDDEDIEEDLAGSDWQPASAVADLGVTDTAPIIDDVADVDGTAEIGEPRVITSEAGSAPSTTIPDETDSASDVAPPVVAQVAPAPEPIPGLDPATGAPVPEVPPTAPQPTPVAFAPTPVETDAIAKPEMPSGSRLKVTQTVQSPEQNAVNADAAKLAEQKVIAENNASLVRQQQIKDQEEIAAKQTALAVEKKARTEALLKDHDERLAAATARNEQALANYQGAKFHDYWSDKTVGDRVIAALAVFLGGLGTAFGGENTAMKNLNSLIQRDYERQKEEIGQKFAVYGETSKNLDRAQELKAHAITDLNLRFAAATEATAAQLAQMKLKQNLPAEIVQRDKNVLEIYEKANVFKQQSAKDTNAMVEWDTYNKAKTGGGPPKKGIPELVKMKEDGKSDGEIAAKAEGMGFKPKDYLPSLENVRKTDREDAKSSKIGTTAVFGAGGAKIADAQTPKDAEKLNEANEAYRNLRATLVDLRDHMEKHGVVAGVGPLNSEEANKRKTMFGQITGLLKQEQLGTLDLGVERLVKAEIGSDFDLMTGRGKAKIDEVLRSLDRKQASTLEQKGLQNSSELLKAVRGEGTARPAAPAAPKNDTDDIRRARIRQASEAIKPNSGATPAQRRRAQQILSELGNR